jgi:hypothetical protein
MSINKVEKILKPKGVLGKSYELLYYANIK